MSVTVKENKAGIDELFADYEDLIREIAEEVKEEAKRFAPVRTGELKNSISVFKQEDGKYQVGSELDYSAHVEFGTRYMRAQPYLRPALDNVLSKLKK